jgi:hypothetical protein
MPLEIEGRSNFVDDQDREDFPSLLGKGLQRTGFHCYKFEQPGGIDED